jgi:hypothetical protein
LSCRAASPRVCPLPKEIDERALLPRERRPSRRVGGSVVEGTQPAEVVAEPVDDVPVGPGLDDDARAGHDREQRGRGVLGRCDHAAADDAVPGGVPAGHDRPARVSDVRERIREGGRVPSTTSSGFTASMRRLRARRDCRPGRRMPQPGDRCAVRTAVQSTA